MPASLDRPWMHTGEFREVPGYPGLWVSSTGQVRRAKNHGGKGKPIYNDTPSVSFDKKGRRRVRATPTSIIYVARAVALAWLPRSPDPEAVLVHHKDGNKLNDAVSNLEWIVSFRKLPRDKKTLLKFEPPPIPEERVQMILEIRRLYDNGVRIRELAEKYGLSVPAISAIALEHSWSSIWGRGWGIKVD